MSRRRSFVTLKQPFLVHREADLGEKQNVAANNPEVVATRLKHADRVRRDLGDVGNTHKEQRPSWPAATRKKEYRKP